MSKILVIFNNKKKYLNKDHFDTLKILFEEYQKYDYEFRDIKYDNIYDKFTFYDFMKINENSTKFLYKKLLSYFYKNNKYNGLPIIFKNPVMFDMYLKTISLNNDIEIFLSYKEIFNRDIKIILQNKYDIDVEIILNKIEIKLENIRTYMNLLDDFYLSISKYFYLLPKELSNKYMVKLSNIDYNRDKYFNLIVKNSFKYKELDNIEYIIKLNHMVCAISYYHIISIQTQLITAIFNILKGKNIDYFSIFWLINNTGCSIFKLIDDMIFSKKTFIKLLISSKLKKEKLNNITSGSIIKKIIYFNSKKIFKIAFDNLDIKFRTIFENNYIYSQKLLDYAVIYFSHIRKWKLARSFLLMGGRPKYEYIFIDEQDKYIFPFSTEIIKLYKSI